MFDFPNLALKRRDFITLIAGCAIIWSPVSHAQQATPIPRRIGLLSGLDCSVPTGERWWSNRLTELGWTKKQVLVDCVSTAGRLDQLSTLAHELVSRRPEVLLTVPATFVKALLQETTTTPIVMLSTPDPVRSGLVTNLARPEGNVTGVAWFGFDIIPKRIEILKEIVPHLKRVGIITTSYGKHASIIEDNMATAARALGFDWHHFRPAAADDYDEIFARMESEHYDAAYITADPLSTQPANGMRIVQLALRHNIPAIGELAGLAKNGLLAAYGQDFVRDFMQASEYVDKILRGTKPSDLPVVQATNLQLVINLKTAKSLRLTVPPSLLARADEVIE